MAFVVDPFTDVAGTELPPHVGTTGATWTARGTTSNRGTITAGNRCRNRTAGGVSRATASGTPASAEYDVDADFHFASVANTTSVGGRVDSGGADTGYYAQYVGNALTLQKRIAGVATTLGSYSDTGVGAGTTRAVKLKLRAAGHSIEVDSVVRISPVVDTDIATAGLVGFRFIGAGTDTTAIHVDNLSASDSAVADAELTSSRALPFAGTAAATVRVSASSTKALPLSGSATLKATVALSSSRALPFGGTAAATVSVAAASTKALPFGGTTTLAITVSLGSSKALTIAGTVVFGEPALPGHITGQAVAARETSIAIAGRTRTVSAAARTITVENTS